MAHKKAAGSAKNLRDSNAKYRGVKIFGGQSALAWNIIIRQKGDKYQLGTWVYKGKDFTIHAAIDGIVSFRKKAFKRYDGRSYLKTVVDVVPADGIQNRIPVSSASAKKAPKKKEEVVSTEKVSKDVSVGKDDLTKIEWIDPVIQWHFYDNGILTYADLSWSKIADLRKILADNNLSQHDPKTWKKQATLAKNGKWDELQVLQDELNGGK